MRLCSITLTSETKEAIIGDALRSVVSWADICLLVVIGPMPNPDNTISIADKIGRDKMRLTYVDPSLSMSEMRNVGLEKAAKLGADLSCQLDTDERIITNGQNIRRLLEKLPDETEVAYVTEDTGNYDKLRFVRTSCQSRFVNHYHEEFKPDPVGAILPGVRFHELPKSPEVLESNRLALIEGMKAQFKNDSKNSRWAYHLGLAYEQGKDYAEALYYYMTALELAQTKDELAWLRYRSAVCEFKRNRLAPAVAHCLWGMTAQPEHAELPYLLGILHMAADDSQRAIAWSKIAVVHGWGGGRGQHSKRTGQKDIEALFEGPYETMAEAYRVLGQTSNAAIKTTEANALRRERLTFCQKGR